MSGFTENIVTEQDRYAQMSKNTVDSKGQLKESETVKFDNPDGTGKRVMFVGNSITLHGVKPEIGWHGAWGMAASSKENDYVHQLEKMILEKDPLAAFCICQAARWERAYKNGSETHSFFENAREFEADIIVFRCIENCLGKEFDHESFERELDALLGYLDGAKKAKFIVTTGFWHHPGDSVLCSYAMKKGYPCVELGDLGEREEMKAIGLFEHHGVANHPGDLGMQMIAKRIAEQLLPLM